MKRTVIMTAVIIGFLAATHAAVKPIWINGTDAYNNGDYEVFTGDTSFGGYDQRVDEPEGQTFTTTNAFDLGAITFVYEADVAVVSGVTLYISEVDDPNTNSYIMPPPAESTLFSATFDVPLSSGGDDTLFILLGTNVSLAADSSYMVSFDVSGASSVDFWWRRSGSSGASFYPDGQRVYSGTGSGDRDYLLGLGVTPPVTANDDGYYRQELPVRILQLPVCLQMIYVAIPPYWLPTFPPAR